MLSSHLEAHLKMVQISGIVRIFRGGILNSEGQISKMHQPVGGEKFPESPLAMRLVQIA